jgi:hypothetical protein
MIPGFNYFDYLRSLSFGGLVGGGIAGLVYINVPYLHTLTDIWNFMLYGSMLGAAVHRGFSRLSQLVLHPLGRFLIYYEQQIELDLQFYFGRISQEEYKAFRAELTKQRFLGSKGPPDKLQLPPASPA